MATVATKTRYATVNPYTNDTVREFQSLSADEVDAAVRNAHESFADWRALPIERRAAAVGRAGQMMLEQGEELARLLTLEVGKLVGDAKWEVAIAGSILNYYGEHGPSFARERRLEVGEGSATLVKAPLGVLLGVQPWNFPLYQVARFAGPNLVLGNTILLKHAESCPQSAIALERLFHEAGVLQGAYTNLFVELPDIQRIIEDPVVQGASLTGSERAGASVGELCGRNLKKSVLELGGSDPFIVLDAENLERTVAAAVVGRMSNTGQSCVAAKRFIVRDEVFDSFLAALWPRFAALRAGDPSDPTTTLGPLSSERAAVALVKQIDDAVQKGATPVVGGGRIDRPGAFVEPTILTNVTPDMRAYHEELFGPVAVVYRVADDDAAVALANATHFGLGGSIFCSDIARARRVAEHIESGMVWINQATSTAPELPFGGIKRSGYGRELSYLGMDEFANHKLIRTFEVDGPLAS